MRCNEFICSIRVYYEDTDAAGMVYHSNYLLFMERARTEWLRAYGFSQEALRHEQGIIFAIRELNIKFLLPARLDDLLDVSAKLTGTGGASLQFIQTISNRRQQLICTAEVNCVCLDAKSLKPHRLPIQLKAELNNDN